MKKTTADYWAPRINAEWRKSIEGILGVGRQLIAAKATCEHGEFLRLFKGHDNAVAEPLPFGEDAAQRLMAVASHPVISNADQSRFLPQSYQTLCELTKLDDETLLAGIKAGEITPDMTRTQATALRADPIEKSANPFLDACHEIKLCVERHERKLATQQRLELVLALRQLAEGVEYGLRFPPIGGDLDESIGDRLRREVPPLAAMPDAELVSFLVERGLPVLAKALAEEQAVVCQDAQ